jgi:hypothetical protein
MTLLKFERTKVFVFYSSEFTGNCRCQGNRLGEVHCSCKNDKSLIVSETCLGNVYLH